MTSLTAQIQTLISEIDAALNKANPRLPWGGSNEATQQRQVLEQTRNALAALKQQAAALAQPQSHPTALSSSTQAPTAESAQQVLQAMLQEMNYLRANMVQPLRTDLEMLRQQRDALQQEIRQLEMQRQQYLLPSAAANQQMLNDSMQALIARLREDLSEQIAQIAASRGGQAALPDPSFTSSGAPQPLLDPTQRLEQIQALQAQSDQMLLKLDSTLRVVFESMQSNIQSYQESLQAGLENMHALGQQGEAMFAALVNQLAQQLGREASSYLQSTDDWQAPRSLAGEASSAAPPPSAGSEAITDAQIDLFLNELGAMAPLPSNSEASIPIAPPLPDPGFLNLDLDRSTADSIADLSISPDLEEDFTLFQVDALLPSDDDEDRTVIQTDAIDTELTPSQQALDEALERLAQAAAAQNQPLAGLPVPTPTEASQSPAAAELDDFYESMFGAGAGSPDVAIAAEPPIADAAADLEGALFEGLEDPATLESDPPEEGAIEPAEPAPIEPDSSTLEDFLFSAEPEPESTPAIEDDLTPDAAVESIGSLSELIADPLLPEAPPPVPEPGEEAYVPAAPDEDLLAAEDFDPRPDRDLQLDPDTLQQLSEDLSSLETRPPIELLPAPNPSDLAASDDGERTLALEPDSPYQHPSPPPPPEPTEPFDRPEDSFLELAPPLERLAADEPTAELTLEDFGFTAPPDEPAAEAIDPLLADLDELFPPLPEPETEPVDTVNAAIGAPDEQQSIDSALIDSALDDIAPDDSALDDTLNAADWLPESNMTLAELLEPAPAEESAVSQPDRFPEPAPDPIDAQAELADLFELDTTPTERYEPVSPSPVELEPAAPENVELELAIDDFRLTPAAARMEPSDSEPLTLADFVQDDVQDDLVFEETAGEDLFGSAELEDLLTEAPQESALELEPDVALERPEPLPEPELAPEPEPELPESIANPAEFADLLFFEEVNSPPEALAPEEAGLTFSDFSEADFSEPSLPASASIDLEAELAALEEDLFTLPPDDADAEFEAALDELTLDDLAEPAADGADFDWGDSDDRLDDEVLLSFEAEPAELSLEALDLAELESAEPTIEAPLPASPSPDSRPDNLPTAGSAEENTFTLDGIDSLFEELTQPPVAPESEEQKKNVVPETVEERAEDLVDLALSADVVPDLGAEPASAAEAIAPAPVEPIVDDFPVADLASDLEPSPVFLPDFVPPVELEDDISLEDEPDSSFTVASTANLTPVPPPDDAEANAGIWCLGIDIGTTGLSAVLLNRATCELYPIYWSEPKLGQSIEKSFRLPTTVYLSGSGIADGVGSLLIDLPHSSPPAEADAVLLHDFKPYLKVGVPHYSPQAAHWEPMLQWSDSQTLALTALHQALRTLLATLSAQRFLTGALNEPAGSSDTRLVCGAVGLAPQRFQIALQQLVQVVVGYPANWSDTYTLNIREAVLGARLVAHPEQICFLEEAIAAVLSSLRSSDGRAVILPNGLSQKSQLHNADWRGGTLAISAGAAVTEMAIVSLPESLSSLSYSDFTVRSLAYAGNAIDQDIICQLLYPPRFRQRREGTRALPSARGQGGADDDWNWQATNPQVAQSTWDSLGLSDLPLPLPGEPDLENRQRLQQRLESSPLGQSLLEAAKHLKLIFQHQDRFTLELGDQQWQLSRQELGSRVILPYIQRLNRELNTLLAQTGIPMQAINQVVCTGGTASLRAIARWLRQKLPNATIIQDTYASSRGLSPLDSRPLTCSRIAYGLATLPLHFQVLDVPRQQYSDYFLLLELLRSFPDQPLTSGGVMQLLERRGINTQACHLHVLALLEGHLPPGLVPTERDAHLLTPASRQNPEYAALLEAPLFYKRDNQTYEPNYVQWHRFQQYLSSLLASTHQTLTEPLAVNIV